VPAFLAACAEQSISVMSLPTAYWHEIAGHLAAGGPPLPDALRLVVIAGEKVLPERLAEWRRRAPSRVRLVNTYGVTESTIISTAAELGAGLPRTTAACVGRPVADSEIDLLDASLSPVPFGVPGEIFIGGGLLARGYLDRPELTAERFVPHPFAPGGARLYRSGDLARVLPDGQLEFLGRRDRQVKVRGYRVELAEIEAALARYPAVTAAAVVQAEDAGGKRLVGYVVPRERPGPAAAELRSFLRDRLPEYMLPAVFVLLDALPLTPNGKVHRAALPPAPALRPETGPAYVPPRNGSEQAIAAIWREVLGLERVGVQDNFFDLGGHSLLLIQVNHRLREQFGQSVPLVELFEYPTVGLLAVRLDRGRPAAPLSHERIQARAAHSRAAVSSDRFLAARRRLGTAAQDGPGGAHRPGGMRDG